MNMKTAFILLLVLLYFCVGFVISYVIARNVIDDVKTEEHAEALAALLIFAGVFWPFVPLLILVATISDNDKNEEE